MLSLAADSPESPAAAVAFPQQFGISHIVKLQECVLQIACNLGWRTRPNLAQEWHAISAGETH